jgi:hypothetical protein
VFSAPITIALIAIGAFAAVLAQSLRRRGAGSLAFKAGESLSGLKPLWDAVASVSMLLGFSIVFWAFFAGVWWQALIVWLVGGLIGGFVGGIIWAGLQLHEKALVYERVAHVVTLLTGGGLWVWALLA